MYTLLIVLFVMVCAFMIIAILLQASKGGGLASSFGGMGSAGGFLGARGAVSFLQKTTIGLAIAYGLLCLVIGLLSKPGELPQSETQQKIQQEQQTTPSQLPSPGDDQNAPAPEPGQDNQ